VVLQDIVLGPDLVALVDQVQSRPRYVVVLAPRADVVRAREDSRREATGKVAYKPGDVGVTDLDAQLRLRTPRIGLWLDSSEQTVAETVDDILSRVWTDGAVD
jgi:hypothetical protein